MTASRLGRSAVSVLAGFVLLAAACGSSGDEDVASAPSSRGAPGLVAQVASYDLVAGRPGRFIVGLLSTDKTKVVSFGTVELAFSYLGARRQRQTGEAPAGDPPPR